MSNSSFGGISIILKTIFLKSFAISLTHSFNYFLYKFLSNYYMECTTKRNMLPPTTFKDIDYEEYYQKRMIPFLEYHP